MALVGIRVGATREYELKRDPERGTPEATKFLIGTVLARVAGWIKDRAATFTGSPDGGSEITAAFHGNDAAYDLVRFGLKGWSNFRNDTGNDLPFKTESRIIKGVSLDAVTDECMDALSLEDIRELSEEIEKANTVDPAEGKTSSS